MSFEIEVYSVPDDQAWSGDKPYQPKPEDKVTEIRKRWQPIYAFCPECTITTYYDKRWKEHKPKRMSSGDYTQDFKMVPNEDSPSGFTNQCRQCGFQMKDREIEEVNHEEQRGGEDAEIEWRNHGYLHEGIWWITLDDLKTMLKMGFNSPVEMHFAFVVEGATRIVTYDKLMALVKKSDGQFESREGSEDMGIAMHHFRTL